MMTTMISESARGLVYMDGKMNRLDFVGFGQFQF